MLPSKMTGRYREKHKFDVRSAFLFDIMATGVLGLSRDIVDLLLSLW